MGLVDAAQRCDLRSRVQRRNLASLRSQKAPTDLLDHARERLDRSEAAKARIMTKIERLETRLLGRE